MMYLKMYIWNLYGIINQSYPNKFKLKKLKTGDRTPQCNGHIKIVDYKTLTHLRMAFTYI